MFRLQRRLASLCLVACLFHGVLSECTMDMDECEFWLEVSHRLSMMYGKYAVYPHMGKLFKFDANANDNTTTPIDPNEVIVSDGWETQKLIVAANGTMPGPPIEVYEGQTVVIHVTNKMRSAALTLHWHGLHQSGSPWMDGVAYITQCPIEPGLSFTYRFKAYPKGTFWYHSHIGAQLGMGLVGAFIIREKKSLPMPEHIMLLQDWNHDWDADVAHLRMVYGSYSNRSNLGITDSLEGAHFSNFLFQSGLINGRGRFFYKDGSSTMSPLTVYPVKKGESYRFRVIGGGNLYPFRVSVDGHIMKLKASDGFDIDPVMVESFVINPGERFDFIILVNETVDNYWIRAETLEIDVKNHIALAILRYDGATEEDPESDRMKCMDNDKCIVANCPFSYYPTESFTECRTFDDLKAGQFHRTPGATVGLQEEIEDVFLNFAFPGIKSFPGSVNGIRFKKPPVSSLTQPKGMTTLCKPEDDCGEQKHCHCTNSLNLQHGKVYQMIMLNMGNGKGWAHPIHMHGHSFHVVKMGYAVYNTTTGRILADNTDIDCRGDPEPSKSFCNSATWSNSSWGGNNVPGLELKLPPLKDTIIVPTGGYAVVRIRADNPGVWFMHCHVELHNLDGMAMMVNESFDLHPHPPQGFPRCGDFLYDEIGHSDKQEPSEKSSDSDDSIGLNIFWIVVGCLIAIVVIETLIILCLYRHDRSPSSSSSPASASVDKTGSSHDGSQTNKAFDSIEVQTL